MIQRNTAPYAALLLRLALGDGAHAWSACRIPQPVLCAADRLA